jgi:hypothetical protein
MAMRLGKLYDALVQAGATTEQASDAAEEVATFETRMQTIERKLSRLEALQWATFVAAATILVRIYWP